MQRIDSQTLIRPSTEVSLYMKENLFFFLSRIVSVTSVVKFKRERNFFYKSCSLVLFKNFCVCVYYEGHWKIKGRRKRRVTRW